AKSIADSANNTANSANSTAGAASTAAGLATTTANAAKSKADDAVVSADLANAIHAEAANDDKLTPVEKQQAKKEQDIIKGEHAGIIAEATKFSVESKPYKEKYDVLNNYLTSLLADLSKPSDIVGATYRENFKNLYDTRQTVLNLISSKAKSLADTAQTAADSAKSKADDALADALTANNLHADISSDGKLTASEKQQAKKEWDIVYGEYAKIKKDGEDVKVPTNVLNDYTTKYNALNSLITPLVANLTTTSDVSGTTYRNAWKNYYDARQVVLSGVTSVHQSQIKQTADKISLIVTDGSNASGVTIQPNAITAISSQINLKGNAVFASLVEGDGTTTQILGGKIKTNSISANKLILSNTQSIVQFVHGENVEGSNITWTSSGYWHANFPNSQHCNLTEQFTPVKNLDWTGKNVNLKIQGSVFSGSSSSFRIEVHFYTSNKTWIRGVYSEYVRPVSTNGSVSIALNLGGVLTDHMYYLVRIAKQTPDTSVYGMQGFSIVQMNAGELIVDGSIKANHLVAGKADIADI
ncbi:MAG: hypothetical protein ACRC1D_08000, partial [Culicoidibacterales bacterium]